MTKWIEGGNTETKFCGYTSKALQRFMEAGGTFRGRYGQAVTLYLPQHKRGDDDEEWVTIMFHSNQVEAHKRTKRGIRSRGFEHCGQVSSYISTLKRRK